MTTAAPTVTKDVPLERDRALRLLHEMLLIRRFEEKSAEMYSLMKIRGFLHLYIGEEAVAVGVMEHLRPEDHVVATYREHGQAIARGVSPGAVMAEMYGKQEGTSRGRGGSMHIFDAATNFAGGNAIVGGHLPLAVGLAMALKMQGKPGLAVCFFGDGAVAEGEFHESLNLSALWHLPVLWIYENNRYGMGTAIEKAQSETEVAKKAAAYRMPAEAVDGIDILAVSEATRRAVEHVRAGKGPYFLECKTYRFRAHSMFDAELYRDKSEVEAWKHRDPIRNFVGFLRERELLDDDVLSEIEQQVDDQIEKAVEFAEAGSWEPVEDLERFVYSERSES